MCDGSSSREALTFLREASLPSLSLLSISQPNLDTLPHELIIVHLLQHLANSDAGALAQTCGRLFRLLRHEREYRLSSVATRKYFEDAAFHEEVNSRIPAGKLSLYPFECALRAFHFAPYAFKRARALFEEALADERATGLEKARSHLSLFVLHIGGWGGPGVDVEELHYTAAAESVSLLLCEDDAGDPVRASEMGFCHLYGVGTKEDHVRGHSLFASSANGACATGMFFLGSCLYAGLGVARDTAASVAQFERAIAMGHFGAMYWLGSSLYYGNGVRRDEKRGIALVREAAVDEGDWRASEWLEKNKDELRRRGLLEDV